MSEIVWNPDCPVGIPATVVNTLTKQDQFYGSQTSSRSFWSFYTKNDILNAFIHDSNGADDKRIHVPETFTDTFEDLMVSINVMSPRFPITIVWNRHLPHFDSTREDQDIKTFPVLPSDLPFSYGSLTDLSTSFRSWLGSYVMFTFDIPGLEFFAITGTDKFNSE